MFICYLCNFETSDNSNICSFCESLLVPNEDLCTNCNKNLTLEESIFCNNCRNKKINPDIIFFKKNKNINGIIKQISLGKIFLISVLSKMLEKKINHLYKNFSPSTIIIPDLNTNKIKKFGYSLEVELLKKLSCFHKKIKVIFLFEISTIKTTKTQLENPFIFSVSLKPIEEKKVKILLNEQNIKNFTINKLIEYPRAKSTYLSSITTKG